MNDTMTLRERSLLRLEQLTDYYKSTRKIKAVLAFGSCGVERERFDQYSDLDFLVVCRDETKQALLNDIQSLSILSPVAFWFINYGDAVKLMFLDGVFCDYGIVTQGQLGGIPHAEGVILWCEEGFDTMLCKSNLPTAEQPTQEVLVGEILTALYVGMCRDRRGEHTMAFQMIQVDAVNLLMQLYAMEHKPEQNADPFSAGRRAEINYPALSKEYPRMMQGYEKNAQSALSVLDCLNRVDSANAFMVDKIAGLCAT